MDTVTTIRVLGVLALLLLLPGWFLLAISGLWKSWTGLQRWIIAVGLSIAFYPILFYGVRSFLPLGPYKLAAVLAVMLLTSVWLLRKQLPDLVRLDRVEWLAVTVIGATIFIRLWVLRDHPFPAWSDSLHHTLLTKLTAIQGRLPATLEPYEPISLDQYHLGLYAITAPVMWLARVPAHIALLWTAQVLNGLCGIGVYLVLDRRVGRTGALLAAAVIGLYSHQPAFYVNWGRFTQLAGQVILPIAWVVLWDFLSAWRQKQPLPRWHVLWQIGFAGALIASIFLIHFRVAFFLLFLIAGTVLWELFLAVGSGRLRATFLAAVGVGASSLFFVIPALTPAISYYVSTRGFGRQVVPPTGVHSAYFDFAAESIPYLVAHPLLLWTGIGALVLGILLRNRLVWGIALWLAALFALGNTYRLGIPLLNVTNLGAIYLLFYIPVGLVIGIVAQDILDRLGMHRQEKVLPVVWAGVLVLGFVASHVRLTEVETNRFFVTPADVRAMEWIRDNTPADARFAINTHFWLPTLPHGSDAGYWIPYFTGRKTNTGSMLSSLGAKAYRQEVAALSQLAQSLVQDPAAAEELARTGVSYVYVGCMENPFSLPLRGEVLATYPHLKLAHQDECAWVFQIRPSP
ncbi:MAG: hypothetical protein KJZ86_07055 [Caldilineaceae bacterium]|nr:hypothetical protein [Caldilineaceae bacterium]